MAQVPGLFLFQLFSVVRQAINTVLALVNVDPQPGEHHANRVDRRHLGRRDVHTPDIAHVVIDLEDMLVRLLRLPGPGIAVMGQHGHAERAVPGIAPVTDEVHVMHGILVVVRVVPDGPYLPHSELNEPDRCLIVHAEVPKCVDWQGVIDRDLADTALFPGDPQLFTPICAGHAGFKAAPELLIDQVIVHAGLSLGFDLIL